MRTRWKILIVGVVLVVAAATLFAQVRPRMARPGGGFGHHGFVGFLLAEHLDLDDSQMAKAEEIRKFALDSMLELRSSHLEIRAAVREGKPVDSLADAQGQRVAELIKAGAAKWNDLRVSLRPDQLEKIDELRKWHESREPAGGLAP